MASVAKSVIDNGIASLKSAATKLYLNTSLATTYTEASSTYAKGNKTVAAGSIFPNALADGTDGRKVTTLNITDGSVTGDGVVAYWAITDASNLLASGSLSGSQTVSNGNTFQLAPFDITVKYQ